MKRILFVTIILIFSCGMSRAEVKSLVYHEYDKDTGEVVLEMFVTVEDLGGGRTKFTRRLQGKECMITDEITVDAEYNTLLWKRTCPGENTDYTGENDGSVFAFKGKLKGAEADQVIDYKSRPFYIIPKLNLSKFALSGMPKIKFAMPNRDNLSKLIMQAKSKGRQVIDVNGEQVEAVKVYYSALGIREKYYWRDYYFRTSDGIFVKKVEPDGTVEELVSEK